MVQPMGCRRRSVQLAVATTTAAVLVVPLLMPQTAAADPDEPASDALQAALSGCSGTDGSPTSIRVAGPITAALTTLQIPCVVDLDLDGHDVSVQNVVIAVGQHLAIRDTIGSGTLTADASAVANTAGIQTTGATLSIHSGTVVAIPGKTTTTIGVWAAGIGGVSGQAGGTVTITGGTVNASNTPNGAGIGGGSGGAGGTVTITGGTVTAGIPGDSAGIGGGRNGDGGSLTIAGGTVTTSSIGGGMFGAAGTILITGGTVTADRGAGARAAGIGSHRAGQGGSVTITGGTVTARGGNRGAGIGTGPDGALPVTVTITGGTVTAIGGAGGAGIGGGDRAVPGAVTITGGSVTATGGPRSAGIGGGGGVGGGAVTVSGGTVIANGGPDGAGIGGGANGSGGEVTVSGGTVTATGGVGATAIGHGSGPSDMGSLTLAESAVREDAVLEDSRPVTSITFVATQLGLLVEPSASVVRGQVLGSQPVVQLRHASGGAVSQSGVLVSVAVASGAGTLGGTVSVATDADGRAAFSDLSISEVGEHQLVFSAEELAPVTSAVVEVTPDVTPDGPVDGTPDGPVDVTEDAVDVTPDAPVDVPAPQLEASPAERSVPTVACTSVSLQAGTVVTCDVSGGEAGSSILWRVAYNPVIAEAGVTLDASGSGAFSFMVPVAALGEVLTVELVDWTVPVALGVVGGPVPTSLPAGGGPVPLWPLGLLALAGGLALWRCPPSGRPLAP